MVNHRYIFLLIIILTIIYLTMNYMYSLFYNTNINFVDLKQDLDYKHKKACILISGQIRKNYYKTLLTQKLFLIEPLNADVFCVFNDTIKDEDKNKIIKLLNPKSILWVSDKDTKYNNSIDINLFHMYFKINKCNSLKTNFENDNNINYDIAVRTRPDCYIKTYLPTNIVNNINNDTIYSPKINDIDVLSNVLNMGINDQFWLSDSKTMNTVSNIYFKLLNDSKITKTCKTSEIILKRFLSENKIKIQTFSDFPFIIDKLSYDNNSLLSSIIYLFNKPNILKCL